MRLLRGRSPIHLIPVVLLFVAIAIHGVRIEVYNQDPQSGSAFAMFSTGDVSTTRRVLATVPGDTGIVLDLPNAVDAARTRLVHAPSDDSARRLANALLELKWEVEGGTATVGSGATFDQVRVQVVGLEVDGHIVSRRIFTDVVVGRSGT